MSERLSKHLTPNNKLISYDKLYKLVSHQVKYITTEMKKVEQDTLYYVLHDEETLKNYSHYQTALEQWEWLLEVLQEQHDGLSF